MLPVIIFEAWCQCTEQSDTVFDMFIMIAISLIFACFITYISFIVRVEGDGCFHGSNKVTMAYGTHKYCDEIVKDDIVLLANSKPARVVCVAKILNNSSNNIRLLKFPNGLIITEYHPIKLNSTWCFPNQITAAIPYTHEFDAVYSFLLEMDDGSQVEHGLLVQGVECAPLGHSITGDVIGHDFFGDPQAIRHALISVSPEQFNEGLVEITHMQRAPEGDVCGFLHQP